MTRFLLIAGLITAVVFTAAWAQQPKPQWEYKFIYQCDEKKANAQAADGWELAEMSMASYGSIGVATCAFKRAK